EPGDLEVVIALLDHFPERHVRRIAVLRHVQRSHPERIGLDLERLLPAKEGFAGERENLADLLVGHGVAAARGTIAMDHEEPAGTTVGACLGVRKAGVDCEGVVGVRIHLAWRDGVEALGCLTIAFLDLRSEIARPAADRIRLQQRKAAGLILFPDLELRLLLEDPDQDRRFLLHVLGFDLGLQLVRERLHVTAAHGRRAIGIAAGKRHRRRDRSRRQKRSHQRTPIQARNSPTDRLFPQSGVPKAFPCISLPGRSALRKARRLPPWLSHGELRVNFRAKITPKARSDAPNSPNIPPRERVSTGTLGQDLGEIRAEEPESHRSGFFGKQSFTPSAPVRARRKGPNRRYPSVRPIARNFSRRCRRTVSRSSPASWAKALAMASPVEAIASAGVRWAPPGGSVTIWSITAKRIMSSAVIFMPVAASCALAVSRHRI